jgi:hypothetical protein
VRANLSSVVDTSKLALWGTSFAGGHVLVVSSEPEFAPHITAVVTQVRARMCVCVGQHRTCCWRTLQHPSPQHLNPSCPPTQVPNLDATESTKASIQQRGIPKSLRMLIAGLTDLLRTSLLGQPPIYLPLAGETWRAQVQGSSRFHQRANLMPCACAATLLAPSVTAPALFCCLRLPQACLAAWPSCK